MKTRKFIIVGIISLLLITLVSCNTNDTFELDDCQYLIDEKTETVTLNRYLGNEFEVEIPSSVYIKGKDMEVVSIGFAAFQRINNNLTKIVIPSTVKKI